MASFRYFGSCNRSTRCVRLKGINANKLSRSCCIIRCEERDHLDFDKEKANKRKIRVLIAGGGIGGLVLALAAKHKGFDVEIFEKDLSAVRGEGKHRGPIQLLSSALGVLEAIDKDVARQIMEAGCTTGDRINGLADGSTGEWFMKFDHFTPAVSRGLPLTQVVCRMELQHILLNAVGSNIVHNNSKVVDFRDDPHKVTVLLEDGQQYQGDILVGADGIWSTVRTKLFGAQAAKYSGYTCYSGFTHYIPTYIDSIGYQVFLGLNQYFVASDVGKGKIQWYAFQREPQMKHDQHTEPKRRNNHVTDATGRKTKLLELFGSWCKEVVTLISETPECMILQRDIYDRDMIHSWGKGHVTLLGDAAHPMQPNLGQGGCMAIEHTHREMMQDGYQLVLELERVVQGSSKHSVSDEIASALKRYEKKGIFRVNTIHAMSRMASKMITSYQPYIDLGFHPLFNSSAMRIKHPGIHIAHFFLQIFAPKFLNWMMLRRP